MDREKTRIMLYGAYGYTGRLTAELAAAKNLEVVLAGRSRDQLLALGEWLNLPTRVVSLENGEHLRNALKDISCLLHMAGPFAVTAQPMLDACLATGTNYVDITGEIEVFEAIRARHEEVRRSGITAIPGAGFDVVPSDCLAGYVAEKLDGATSLLIALRGMESPSQGTLRTALRQLSSPVLCRRLGRIVALEERSARRIDFGSGDEPCVPVSWGDVSTSFYSTGIGNITVYFRRSKLLRSVNVAGKLLGPFVRSPLGQQALQAVVRMFPEGPSPSERSSHRATVFAEAMNAWGESFKATLVTPDPYDFTANSALEIASRIRQLQRPLGLVTPFQAFGADFVLTLPGCSRRDILSLERDTLVDTDEAQRHSAEIAALRAALAEGWLFKD